MSKIITAVAVVISFFVGIAVGFFGGDKLLPTPEYEEIPAPTPPMAAPTPTSESEEENVLDLVRATMNYNNRTGITEVQIGTGSSDFVDGLILYVCISDDICTVVEVDVTPEEMWGHSHQMWLFSEPEYDEPRIEVLKVIKR